MCITVEAWHPPLAVSQSFRKQILHIIVHIVQRVFKTLDHCIFMFVVMARKSTSVKTAEKDLLKSVISRDT